MAATSSFDCVGCQASLGESAHFELIHDAPIEDDDDTTKCLVCVECFRQLQANRVREGVPYVQCPSRHCGQGRVVGHRACFSQPEPQQQEEGQESTNNDNHNEGEWGDENGWEEPSIAQSIELSTSSPNNSNDDDDDDDDVSGEWEQPSLVQSTELSRSSSSRNSDAVARDTDSTNNEEEEELLARNSTAPTNHQHRDRKWWRQGRFLYLGSGICFLMLSLEFFLLAVFFRDAITTTNDNTSTSSASSTFAPVDPSEAEPSTNNSSTNLLSTEAPLRGITTSSTTENSTTLAPSMMPTTLLSEIDLVPFGLLYDIDRSDIPADDDYVGVANAMIQFLDAYLRQLYPTKENDNDSNNNSFHLVTLDWRVPPSTFAYSMLSGGMHDLFGTVTFSSAPKNNINDNDDEEPPSGVPSPDEMDVLLDQVFHEDNVTAALDFLVAELSPENIFSTATNIRKVDSISVSNNPGA